MKNVLYIAVALMVAAALGACAGSAVKEEAPVEDQSTSAAGAGGTASGGAQTGTPGSPGSEGTMLGTGGGQVAMMGGKPLKMIVHFEFDSSAVDSEARQIIEQHAAYLSANPDVKVNLEGHADERGTREYNLALGERRGGSVDRMLRVLGVSEDRMTIISYGEEQPLAMGHGESSWRVNRRVEFVYSAGT
ncbi:MAG: peptidoglycan-associated lipoprotein Pal [Acidiferrobacterales bacterium]